MSDTAIAGEGNKVPEILAKRQRKRKRILKIAGGVMALLAFLIWFAFKPIMAKMNYGVCRTYLETYASYPPTLRINQFDEFGSSLRLYFTYTDAFGGTRSEVIECISQGAKNNWLMDDIKIGRISIDPEQLARFNQSVPGIIAAKPDLVRPSPYKDDLRKLKRD